MRNIVCKQSGELVGKTSGKIPEFLKSEGRVKTYNDNIVTTIFDPEYELVGRKITTKKETNHGNL